MQPQISEHSEIIDIFAIVSQIADEVPYNTHHLDHIFRVLKLSQDILKHEPADKMIVEAAACLHDLGRFFDDDQDKHEVISSSKAREILSDRQWERTVIEKVCYAIETHRFSKTHVPETIEARILQDSDKLDALGAIGIVRVVSHDPTRALYDLMNPNFSGTYAEKKYTLSHFYEKILKLPGQLHTERARQIARQRADFTRLFLSQIKAEINFNDNKTEAT